MVAGLFSPDKKEIYLPRQHLSPESHSRRGKAKFRRLRPCLVAGVYAVGWMQMRLNPRPPITRISGLFRFFGRIVSSRTSPDSHAVNKAGVYVQTVSSIPYISVKRYGNIRPDRANNPLTPYNSPSLNGLPVRSMDNHIIKSPRRLRPALQGEHHHKNNTERYNTYKFHSFIHYF